MIIIKEETFINASAKSVFKFLIQIDLLYKIWHPKDHVFCKTILGKLSEKGCIFHFLEIIGGFPLYVIAKVTDVRTNEYIEYAPIFPFSLLKIGKAYFRIEKISNNKSKLIAYVEYGDKLGILDKVVNFIVKPDTAKRHIREEGENLKKHLESQT